MIRAHTREHGPPAGRCNGSPGRKCRITTARTTDPEVDSFMRHHFAIIFAALILLSVSAGLNIAQRNAAAPARPTPRWPDGRVNFGPVPGETGLWNAQGAQLARPDVPSDFGLFAAPREEGLDEFQLSKPK